MTNVVVTFTHDELETVVGPLAETQETVEAMGFEIPAEMKTAIHKLLLAHALVCPAASAAEKRGVQVLAQTTDPAAFHAVSVTA